MTSLHLGIAVESIEDISIRFVVIFFSLFFSGHVGKWEWPKCNCNLFRSGRRVWIGHWTRRDNFKMRVWHAVVSNGVPFQNISCGDRSASKWNMAVRLRPEWNTIELRTLGGGQYEGKTSWGSATEDDVKMDTECSRRCRDDWPTSELIWLRRRILWWAKISEYHCIFSPTTWPSRYWWRDSSCFGTADKWHLLLSVQVSFTLNQLI